MRTDDPIDSLVYSFVFFSILGLLFSNIKSLYLKKTFLKSGEMIVPSILESVAKKSRSKFFPVAVKLPPAERTPSIKKFFMSIPMSITAFSFPKLIHYAWALTYQGTPAIRPINSNSSPPYRLFYPHYDKYQNALITNVYWRIWK